MLSDRPFSDFPFACFFVRSLAKLYPRGEDLMKDLDRVGGTFTHLEGELQ